MTNKQITITLTEEENGWVVREERSGLTTQGTTKEHALMCLIELMNAENDEEQDLIELSEDVFTISDTF